VSAVAIAPLPTRRALPSVRAINAACDAYTFLRRGNPTVANIGGYTRRIVRARVRLGVFEVRCADNGAWISRVDDIYLGG
jgi:hypothetical protein